MRKGNSRGVRLVTVGDWGGEIIYDIEGDVRRDGTAEESALGIVAGTGSVTVLREVRVFFYLNGLLDIVSMGCKSRIKGQTLAADQ